VIVACSVAVSVFSAAGIARGGQSEARIIGQVTDSSGAVLPGVTVTVSGPSLQVGELTTVTTEAGDGEADLNPNGPDFVSQSITAVGIPNPAERQDVRAEKRIAIWSDDTVMLRANVFNVLNRGTVTGVTMRAGATFLRPTAIMPPRIVELSASYSF
jgi:hypothetical protein